MILLLKEQFLLDIYVNFIRHVCGRYTIKKNVLKKFRFGDESSSSIGLAGIELIIERTKYKRNIRGEVEKKSGV